MTSQELLDEIRNLSNQEKRDLNTSYPKIKKFVIMAIIEVI